MTMEEKYILSTKTHEDWRNYLIVNSFFFDVLLKKLRKDLDLPEGGIDDIEELIQWDAKKKSGVRKKITPKSKRKKSRIKAVREMLGIEDKVRRIAYKPIWEIIEKFSDYNLAFGLLHGFVLGDKKVLFRGSSKVLMVSSPADPIMETGIYIKYNPELNEKEMSDLMKQARESYELLFNMTHKSTISKDKNGKPFIKKSKLKIRQRKVSSPTDQQLKIYHATENCLREVYFNDPESIKMRLVFEEVAKKLNSNKNSISRSYHVVLRNFQLPTSVDTKKISS